jgi:hypothetical protein
MFFVPLDLKPLGEKCVSMALFLCVPEVVNSAQLEKFRGNKRRRMSISQKKTPWFNRAFSIRIYIGWYLNLGINLTDIFQKIILTFDFFIIDHNLNTRVHGFYVNSVKFKTKFGIVWIFDPNSLTYYSW